MDVFVIPIGLDRYELYCETSVEAPSLDPAATGFVARIRHRFAVMLCGAVTTDLQHGRNPGSRAISA